MATATQGPTAPCSQPVSRLEVAPLLRDYLSQRLGISHLHFATEPTPVTDGWEAFVYHFALAPADDLPPEFRGPLTLRLFAGAEGVECARQHFAALGNLRQLEYPVPAPVCLEESTEALGGPFLVMERVLGRTLVAHMLARPWVVGLAGLRMARLHVRLHQLPADSFPHRGGSLLHRAFAEIGDTIERHEARNLAAGLDWLVAHRPPEPASPSILHLDFHPLNLIHRPGQDAAVIDWDTADVGDPHADVATTMMLFTTASNPGETAWHKFLAAIGRDILDGFYLHECRKRMNFDEERYRYYLALAALRRLARFARFAALGPGCIGAKPSLMTRHLQPDHLEALAACFRRQTGVGV